MLTGTLSYYMSCLAGRTLRPSWTCSAAWLKMLELSMQSDAPTGLKVEPAPWPSVRLSREPVRPPATSDSSTI